MSKTTIIAALIISIIISIVIFTTIIISCAPTGKGVDHCDRLKLERQHILKFYENGDEKVQLLEVLDSLINKTCDYER